MKNNVLLTGASGFLGSIIKKYLVEQGDKVYTLGRSRESDFVCDLSAEVPEFDKTTFDIVVHAAGKAHIVPKTEAEKQDFFDVNVKGTKNLCNALDNANVKPAQFVFISTVAVYGKDEGEMITENSPLKGDTPYALSKIQCEAFFAAMG